MDELTSPEQVQLFKRIGGSNAAWVPTQEAISLTSQSGVLEVMAVDGAGNQSDIIKMELKQDNTGSSNENSLLSSGEPESEGGCSAAPVGLWWLLAGLFFFRKRRQ